MDYRKRMYDPYVSLRWQPDRLPTIKDYEHYRKIRRHRFMRFLPQDKDARIIDLGCGGGHFLYFLQKEGYSQAQGIDISQEAVDLAERMGVKNIEVGDLFETLPQYKEEFDFIWANQVIEHLKKDEVLGFLDLVYAALKPGGSTLMTTPNAAGLLGARVVFHGFSHETGFTPVSLGHVFVACGFKNVMVYGESPAIHDLLSVLRAVLWKLTKVVAEVIAIMAGVRMYYLWRDKFILEPSIFVVARKPGG